MKKQISRIPRGQRGLTTVEYAVAGAIVTVGVITAFAAMGGSVATTITFLASILPG